MKSFLFPFLTFSLLSPQIHAAPVTKVAPKKIPATRAAVQKIVLSREFDRKPQEITREFAPTDRTLHATVTLDRVSSGDHIKIIWIIENAGGVKNYGFARKVLTTDRTRSVHFSTVFKGHWPRGKYRVDVYANGMRSGQQYFRVK